MNPIEQFIGGPRAREYAATYKNWRNFNNECAMFSYNFLIEKCTGQMEGSSSWFNNDWRHKLRSS